MTDEQHNNELKFKTAEEIDAELTRVAGSESVEEYENLYMTALEELAKIYKVSIEANKCVFIKNICGKNPRAACKSDISKTDRKLCKKCYGNRKQNRFKILYRWRLSILEPEIEHAVAKHEISKITGIGVKADTKKTALIESEKTKVDNRWNKMEEDWNDGNKEANEESSEEKDGGNDKDSEYMDSDEIGDGSNPGTAQPTPEKPTRTTRNSNRDNSTTLVVGET